MRLSQHSLYVCGIVLIGTITLAVAAKPAAAISVLDTIRSKQQPGSETTTTSAPEPAQPGPSAPARAGSALRGGHVTASIGLNVRTGPGVRYRKIGVLPHGTQIVILATSGGWFKITYKERQGWVCGRYVSVSDRTGTPPPGQSDGKTGSGHVTAGGLNVRTGPGVSNGRITSIRRGTKVTILGHSGGWYKIRVGNTVGWSSGKYINVDSPGKLPEKTPPATKSKKGYVTTSGLNVRTGPGTENGRIHILRGGTEVAIVGEKNGWYKIKYGDTIGWVSGKYIGAGGKPPAAKTPPSTRPPAATGKAYVEVPQRTQFDPVNGKYQSSWCGPTALGMIYEYYGRKESTWDIARRTYNFKARNGTNYQSMVNDAKKNGFPNTTVKFNAGFDYLEQNLKQGRPVIVGVEVAWRNGHYMVVVGIEGDKIIVNDPGRRVVRRTFSRSWFLTQWNGRSQRSIVLK